MVPPVEAYLAEAETDERRAAICRSHPGGGK